MNAILRPTWLLLDQLIQSCRRELLICSPWLASSGLNRLADYLSHSLKDKPPRSVEFWSRLADPNTDSGLLLQIIDVLRGAGVSVRVKDSPSLHAKIYLADRTRAIFGSCNLSDSGFHTNLEVAGLISDSRDIQQICAVVDSIDQQMCEVDCRDLAYFVEHQRPGILRQQATIPSITVVPIWNQRDKSVVREETKPQTPSYNDRPATQSVSGLSNPLALYQNGLQLLNERQNEISGYDLQTFAGLKIKAILYPASSDGWVDAAWAGGSMPFTEVEGRIIGQHSAMRVKETFTSKATTNEQKMTWKLLPKRSRTKAYTVANFPVVQNHLEGGRVYYIYKIEKIK